MHIYPDPYDKVEPIDNLTQNSRTMVLRTSDECMRKGLLALVRVYIVLDL